MKTRGAVSLIVLLAVAVLGAGGYVATKKGWFSGETKRAKESTKTTETLIATTDDQKAKASATFQAIGQTNAEAPDSPQKRVIARFVPIGQSLTGAPDPAFLLQLEQLKVAELAGKLEQADKINASILQDTAELQKKLAQAIAAKRASDLALEEAAKEAREEAASRLLWTCAAVAAAALYVWVKLSHISPLTLSAAVHDLRTGNAETNPAIAAIDSATTPFQQLNTRLMVWLRSKLSKLTT